MVWVGVMLGGAVGSALRYAVSLSMGSKLGPDFPYGTLTVNVLGCLLIGLLGVLLTGPWVVREEVRLAILVGGLGGFTTFSTFGADTLALLDAGLKQGTKDVFGEENGIRPLEGGGGAAAAQPKMFFHHVHKASHREIAEI